MILRVNINSVSEDTTGKKFSGTGFMADDEIVDRPYYQHCGFSSIPKANSKGIVDIKNNNIILLATADTQSSRPVLSSAGDVAIYSDANKYIKISAAGDITIITDGGTITVNNGSGTIVLESSGQVNLNSGNLTVDP